MFKLIKILNSGSNVPEPRRVKVGSKNIYSGTALIYNEDCTVGYGTSITAPKCIALCDAPAGSEAMVYEITPDMLFETPATIAPDVLSFGMRLTLGNDSKGFDCAGCMDDNGPVIVYDNTGAMVLGDKITVRLA